MSFQSNIWLNIDINAPSKSLFHGYHNPAFLAFHIHTFLNEQPSLMPLILCPSHNLSSLLSDLEVFCPNRSLVPFYSFDVSPYSGLLPKRQNALLRMRFLSRMLYPEGDEIFLVSAKDSLLRTLSYEEIQTASECLEVGQEISSDFFSNLDLLGYVPVDIVEDLGQYSQKGGVIDLYSPHHNYPVRIELFGDQVESLRYFDPKSQLSLEPIYRYRICPAKELNYKVLNPQKLSTAILKDSQNRNIEKEAIQPLLSQLSRKVSFPELDFLSHHLNISQSNLFDYLREDIVGFCYDKISLQNEVDQFYQEELERFNYAKNEVICPPIENIYINTDDYKEKLNIFSVFYSSVVLDGESYKISLPTRAKDVSALQKDFEKYKNNSDDLFFKKVSAFLNEDQKIVLTYNTETKAKRLRALFEGHNIECLPLEEATSFSKKAIYTMPSALSHSFYNEYERVLFLNESFFYGKNSRKTSIQKQEGLQEKIANLNFSDLKQGDKVVHILHGVATFDGLKEIHINGVQSELIQLSYKDNDKLYLPIYRIHQIQKYRGAGPLDKLGTNHWEKTKIKVKNNLRDIASDLLRLYAKRAELRKTPYQPPGSDYYKFEDAFPYEETEDQLQAIESIIKDMTSDRPMDRLLCGDVGFGKTEVALRACFKAVADKRQVAVLVPTTVLAFQHFDTFIKRFKGFPYRIQMLSRFSSKKEVKQTLADLKDGKVDIIIGTHRLLSQDVSYYNLGLLIIDEEHRFGVKHKERIRQIKTGVDTLAMSATPIPRTLNMSLVGIRDLSLINSAPQDRLPIRTYICKQNYETLRQAIENEIQRGGQVFYLHNRVQSLYQKEQELKEILPKAKIRVGHGQMEEQSLEKTMLSFFKGEFDVFLCTTIIESGIDNPKANTMIIDNAHTFGLSQLYQIRGRVGRSKDRAYCYLVIPNNIKLDKQAQERLRVIQENTALGSGFKVASHDLDLRGAGSILGESQSGNINAVGYDLYMELLEEAIKEARGEKKAKEEIEPDINIPIPALIPDQYIADIRSRLAYYKAMSEANSADDMAKIEEELKDQYGKIPDEVINLMGLMLIRSQCKKLGVKDIRSTKKSTTLAFSQETEISIEALVDLVSKEPQKYKLSPDGRLIIYTKSSEWEDILQEIEICQKHFHIN